jgi:DNA-binding NarL/FixJ family response regulator
MEVSEHRVSDPPAACGRRAISILVVDDHPVVRFGIRSLVNSQPDFQVLGDVSDSRSASQLVKSLCPDVLLLDLELEGGLSSYKLIREVMEADQGTQVVVYTAHDGDRHVIEAIRSGARGYVIKSARPERVYEAIRAVANGGSYLDTAVASLVMGRIGRRGDRRANNSRELSEREHAVLCRLVAGKRNREIASELFISERTVKYHLKSMFGKLRAKNRTEVVRIALQDGLV